MSPRRSIAEVPELHGLWVGAAEDALLDAGLLPQRVWPRSVVACSERGNAGAWPTSSWSTLPRPVPVPEFAARLSRAASDLRDDIARGHPPFPRCTGEAVVLGWVLRDAQDTASGDDDTPPRSSTVFSVG
jgi:hypothetical protein